MTWELNKSKSQQKAREHPSVKIIRKFIVEAKTTEWWLENADENRRGFSLALKDSIDYMIVSPKDNAFDSTTQWCSKA